jgi:hypothetical protein
MNAATKGGDHLEGEHHDQHDHSVATGRGERRDLSRRAFGKHRGCTTGQR